MSKLCLKHAKYFIILGAAYKKKNQRSISLKKDRTLIFLIKVKYLLNKSI